MTGTFLPVGWQDQALCAEVDPDLWFGENTHAAKKLCESCPVRRECLSYALKRTEIMRAEGGQLDLKGTWGGTTTRERRRLLDIRAHSREAQYA